MLLGYIYVGYPCLLCIMAWCARIPRTENHGFKEAVSVSLVIPAYNEQNVIAEKIRNSLAMNYPHDLLEILVIDDGSTDDTAAIARSFDVANLQVIQHDARRGKATAINTAVRHAQGEYLCFSDANVMFSGDAVQRLVDRLADPDVGAVTGRVALDSSESEFSTGELLYCTWERWVQRSEAPLGSLICVDGGMYLVRSELVRPLPSDTILDDLTMSMSVLQQGFQIAYDAKAEAHETGTPTGYEESLRRSRMAAGYVQAIRRGVFPSWQRPLRLWQFLSHKLLRWLSPVLFVVVFVSNLAIANAHLWLTLTLCAQLAAYTVGAAGVLSGSFRRTRLGAVAYYFTISQWATLVGLLKGALNRQNVKWATTSRGRLCPSQLDPATQKSSG